MAHATTISRKIRAAVVSHELVEVSRTIRRADRIYGFVVGAGEEWVVVHAVSPGWFLDGYCAIRVKDIGRIRPWDGGEAFPRRALAYFGEDQPEPLPHVALGTTPALIATVGEAFPLLSIYVETKWPDECRIGVATRVTAKTLHLREITPDAVWESAPTTWALSKITRIDFAGRYEEALDGVSGGRPGSR